MVMAMMGVVVVVVLGVFASAAGAAGAAPGWGVESVAEPTNFSTADNARVWRVWKKPKGECDAFQVNVMNVGTVRRW
jgi:hypothetical protein